MNENLELIYAEVPKIACKGKCQHSCGPIMASAREAEYFESKSGKKFPDPIKIMETTLATGAAMECPYLNPLGQCDVYRSRPLICRLWGVVPAMRCPHGCVPERMLTEEESRGLLRRAE